MKKTRNPVAGNAWKYNRRQVVPPKKGKGSVYNRTSWKGLRNEN